MEKGNIKQFFKTILKGGSKLVMCPSSTVTCNCNTIFNLFIFTTPLWTSERLLDPFYKIHNNFTKTYI